MTRLLHTYQQLLRIDAVALAAAFVLERAFPAERRQPLRKVLFNVAYFLGVIPVVLAVLPQLAGLAGALRATVGRSLFEISSGDTVVGQIAAGLVVVFAWDFFQYWEHRAMHTIACLWKMHRLHHSDRAVNATTAYRNHPTAHVFQFFAIGVPLSLIVPLSALSAAMWIVFFHLYGCFNHMNVRLSLGIFTPVVSGPQLHRIHHSSLEQHRDRNFAAFFPIFDILFGTYYSPGRGEFPPTGLLGRHWQTTAAGRPVRDVDPEPARPQRSHGSARLGEPWPGRIRRPASRRRTPRAAASGPDRVLARRVSVETLPTDGGEYRERRCFPVPLSVRRPG